jgi:hypothetical protein
MTEALQGIPDEWYPTPGNVTFKQGPNGGSWYYNGVTDVSKLSIDNLPTPSPKPIDYNVPDNPGGPRVVQPSPSPRPTQD